MFRLPEHIGNNQCRHFGSERVFFRLPRLKIVMKTNICCFQLTHRLVLVVTESVSPMQRANNVIQHATEGSDAIGLSAFEASIDGLGLNGR